MARRQYRKGAAHDPARVKPLPLAAISFYLHKLFVPLHVKKGGVISRDLGYSTQKKKADFASAGPADIEYQNSHCVLWPRSRDTVSTGKAASSQFCTGFSKNGKLIDALSNHGKLNLIRKRIAWWRSDRKINIKGDTYDFYKNLCMRSSLPF